MRQALRRANRQYGPLEKAFLTADTQLSTHALDTINVANEAIDRQAGALESKRKKLAYDLTMRQVDALIKDQIAGGSGHSKP